jgi:Sulfotransferase family
VERDRVNPYVFIVGCPRSGTTLLGRIADAHPELAIVHESRWIPRCFEHREGLTSDGRVTPSLVERLRDPRALKPFGIDDGEMEKLIRDADGRSFASFVTALFDRYGDRRGKTLVGDKSPGYVRYLPTLHELWPHAKVVHVIRDGRDVCLSVLDWQKGATRFSTFQDDPFTTSAVWWEWYVRLGLEGGSQMGAGGLYHELRYESLVADPELESARLCDFLGIPHDDAMLRFHEGRTRSKPGLSTKSSWLPVTGGLRNWRQQMDPDDVLRFEAAASELLGDLGYLRGVPTVPKKHLDRATRIRETFTEELRARQRPVPGAWSYVSA